MNIISERKYQSYNYRLYFYFQTEILSFWIMI